jgi:hypothetical protein
VLTKRIGIFGTAIGVIRHAVIVAVTIIAVGDSVTVTIAVGIPIVIARPIAVTVVVIARRAGRQGKAQTGGAERDEYKLSHGFLPECALWLL